MHLNLSLILVWVVAICEISVSSLNAQTVKTEQPTSESGQKTQEETQEEKRVRIEEKIKRRRANWQLVRDQVETEGNYFEFDEGLRIKGAGRADSVLRGDERNFDYFLDPLVRSEMNLSDEVSPRFAQRAGEIAKEWKTAMRNAVGHRDEMALQTYQDAIKIFDAQMEQELDRKQMERFQQIKSRLRIQWLGIPEALMSGILELDANEEEKKKIVLALQAEADKIRVDGNRLFIEQVNAMLPGYVRGWEDQDAERLPLLPLQLFLLLDERPSVVMGSFKSKFKEFGLTLDSGYWVFPSPVIVRSRSSNSFLKSNSMKFYSPPSTAEQWLHKVQRSEFNESESAEYGRLIEENLFNMGIRNNPDFKSTRKKLPAGLSRNEQIDFLMEQRFEVNWELDKGFRTENLTPYRNYIRLHALFTLGPDFVYKQLTREYDNLVKGWPNEEEFNKRIAASHLVLEAFVDSQETRLAEFLINQLAGHDKETNFTPNDFISPMSSQYEMMLGPILEYKPGVHPRRRR